MSFNLIDAAKGFLSNEIVNKASAFLGESEHGVSKAMSGVIPSVLLGMVDKSSSGDGANALAGMVQEQHSSGILDSLSGFFGNDGNSMLGKGAGLVSSLLGNKADGLSGLISGFSGIKSSSVSSLLSMAVPALLGLIGKHSGGNTSASGISSLLSSQKDNILGALPSGLNLGSVFGGLANKVQAAPAASHSTSHSHTEERKSGGMGLLFPIILLAGLGMLAWYIFGKGCSNDGHEAVGHGADSAVVKTDDHTATATEIPTTTAAVKGTLDSSGNFIYELGKMISIDLPNGAGKLEVGENSTEARLVNFLNDKNAMIDTVKGNWYEFTNVRFKTGSADITDESMAQLKNLVAISKGYPTAQFKIGGYTDNTGNAASNVTLSQKRADAVMAMIKKLGAAGTAITGAKGYGPEHPIADNATPEGRAQNRRVAVNVKAK